MEALLIHEIARNVLAGKKETSRVNLSGSTRLVCHFQVRREI